MIRLDERLSAIAEFVRPDRRICDVGTDHALLPCFLWEQGARDVTACDINEGPLAAARENVRRLKCEGIKLILSDGLKNVPPCDDIIIAGMGGELILRIVTECDFADADTRFILQPMTKAEVLRYGLYKNGFEIILEKGVFSGGKAYTVMLVRFTGIKKEIDGTFAFFGKCTDTRYINKVNERLRKMGNSDKELLKLIRDTEDII